MAPGSTSSPGWFTWLATRHTEFGQDGHVGSSHLPWLGLGFFVVIPVVGGLVYGPLIYKGAREARGHGVPEVMIAVAENGGRIRWQVSVVKSLASALCIGVGGSVGREGPIVQIGAAQPADALLPVPVPGDQPSAASQPTEPLAGYQAAEVTLDEASAASGQKLSDVDWPPGSTPVSLLRNRVLTWPDPELVLAPGDRITVLVPASWPNAAPNS